MYISNVIGMSIYIYIYIHVIGISIYIYIYRYSACTEMRILYIHGCIHKHIHTYIHTHTHTGFGNLCWMKNMEVRAELAQGVYAHIKTYIHSYIHTIYKCLYTFIYTYQKYGSTSGVSTRCVCMYENI